MENFPHFSAIFVDVNIMRPENSVDSMAASPYSLPNSRGIRVGVIGCGFFAVNHVRAWASIADVLIAALCDRNLGRANRLVNELRLDVPTFADAAEMVDKVAPDFLDIITTPDTHPALVARGQPKIASNRPEAHGIEL
jgi:ornithine cyclodeaminase/alanine dehydrogenase-like protein (mu-crystallin family)